MPDRLAKLEEMRKVVYGFLRLRKKMRNRECYSYEGHLEEIYQLCGKVEHIMRERIEELPGGENA